MNNLNIVYLTEAELGLLKKIVAEEITNELQQLERQTREKAYFWTKSIPGDEKKYIYEYFKKARNLQTKHKRNVRRLNEIQYALKNPGKIPYGYSD